MSLQIYSKEYEDFVKQQKHQQKRQKFDRAFSIFLLSLGILAVLFAVGPAVIWQVSTSKTLGTKVQNPVAQNQVISPGLLVSGDIQVVKDLDGFTYFTTAPANDKNQYSASRPAQFYLTIPKLKIDKAQVIVDSLFFQKNLALFPKTAIPGDVGNAFITGHSALPVFNDPKDYKTIFTKLPLLEIGDEVIADVEGKNLKFVVQYSKIVDPNDLSVLAPISANGRNLTLMTCVPPGINTKRLVVITSLI